MERCNLLVDRVRNTLSASGFHLSFVPVNRLILLRCTDIFIPNLTLGKEFEDQDFVCASRVPATEALRMEWATDMH